MVKMEDMYTASRTSSIEDDGKSVGGFLIGAKFTMSDSIVLDGLVGRVCRHQVEYKSDEKQWD